MRKKHSYVKSNFSIIVLDDEIGIIDSLMVIAGQLGYDCEGFTDPEEALEAIKTKHYDLLILDFLMKKMNGDKVVEKVREFNSDLYILLLTGHKDLAPPMETIKLLDIQGYCEKSDKFDQLILLIESAMKSVSMVKRIKKYEDGLNKILSAVPKIYQLQPIGYVLEEILLGLLPLVNSTDAFILNDSSLQANTNGIIYKGLGKYDKPLEEVMSKLDVDLIACIGKSREEKRVLVFEKGIIFPMINESNQCMGVIYIEAEDTNDGLQLLEIYSTHAASSIRNAFLHSMVNIKNEELKRTYDNLRKHYIDTIDVLRLTVDAKDEYTRGHSDRVSYYAVKLGEAFALSYEDIELLRLSGVFHDIGKIGTSDDILFKKEALKPDEYNEVKKHTIKGAYIMSAVSMFKNIVPIIKSHHERIDGSGYPDGLIGDEIPFLSRIISVVDAFDAMTSDRFYRSKLELSEAISQLEKGAGTQFDKTVVEKFIKLLSNFDLFSKELSHTYFCIEDDQKN